MPAQKAKRYAAAYFNVAKEDKVLKAARSDVGVLEVLASRFKALLVEMNSPVSDKAERFVFVRTLFKVHKFQLITQNLLYLLAEHRDLNLLERVVRQWKKLYLAHQNEAAIEVVSVKKLGSVDLNLIKKFFEKEFGKKVQLKNTLDATILGGLMIKVGSVVLDNSVANRIKNLGLALKGDTRV
jgi:F-type H+-transporting ATPase subunit delta